MWEGLLNVRDRLRGNRDQDPFGNLRASMQSARGAGNGSPLSAENLKIVRQIRSTLRKGGWIAVLVAAGLALSIASFYTTYLGLTYFTDNNHIVAALISFGIQATVFGGSWVVANDMIGYGSDDRGDDADAESKPGVIRRFFRMFYTAADFTLMHFVKVFVLVASMSTSIYFSFAALYNTVVTPQQRALINMSVARSTIGDRMREVDTAVLRHREELIDALLKDRNWIAYKENLDKLLVVGEQAKDRIKQIVAQERARLEGLAATARQQQRTAEEKVAQLNAQLEARKGSAATAPKPAAAASDPAAATAALDKRIADLEGEIRGFDAEISRLTALMAEEEQAGGKRQDGSRRPTGQGPEWRRLNVERTAVKSRRDALAADLRNLQAERRRTASTAQTEAEQERARKERELADVGKLNAELAQAQGELAVAKEKTKAAESELFAFTGGGRDGPGGAAAGAVEDPNELVNNVRKAIAVFTGSGAPDAYEKMRDGCVKLSDILRRTPEIQRESANLTSCDSSGFSAKVAELANLDEGLVWYRANCLVDADFNKAPTVQSLVDRGRTCFTRVSLPARTRLEFTDRLDDIERVHSEDSSHFERTTAALARSDRLAWFAFFIAFAIDFLSFGSAIIGVYSIASPLMRGGHLRDKIDYEDIQLVAFVTHTAYEDDPPDVRNRKVFLRYIKTGWGDRSQGGVSQAQVDLLSVPPEHQVLVHGILNIAARKRLAGLVKGHSNLFWVHYDFVMDCNQVVGKYEKEYATVNGPRPTGPGGGSPAGGGGLWPAAPYGGAGGPPATGGLWSGMPPGGAGGSPASGGQGLVYPQSSPGAASPASPSAAAHGLGVIEGGAGGAPSPSGTPPSPPQTAQGAAWQQTEQRWGSS